MAAKHTSGSAADPSVESLTAELVGVREQLRQAEQELGARQKPRESGEGDGLGPRFRRPNIEAPYVVWEYAMTLERWVINAEERVDAVDDLLRRLAEWDMLYVSPEGKPVTGDGPYWQAEIAKVRALLRKEPSVAKAGTPTGGSAASPELARELAALRVERDAAVEALRLVLARPRWLSIGSHENTAEFRISRNLYERALAAASRSSTEPPQTDLGGDKVAVVKPEEGSAL